MPLESKPPKGAKKGKQHRPTVVLKDAAKSESEEDGGGSSFTSAKTTTTSTSTAIDASKSKNRVKSRQKSTNLKDSKGNVAAAALKRPKSRPNLILSKKAKSMMKANKAHGQGHGQKGRTSPEGKNKTTTSLKKSKSRSVKQPVSGGGGGGGGISGSGSGLSCKSVGPKRSPKCAPVGKSPGGASKPKGSDLHQSKASVESSSALKTGGGSGGNTIIFLGSPNDPAALQLLQNLVKQINPSAETAKQQEPQQPQQEKQQPATSAPSTATAGAAPATSANPEDQVVVTDQTQLEELYDAMYDLSNNVKTIHDSYEKIVVSLVTLQHRRLKTKKEKVAGGGGGVGGGVGGGGVGGVGGGGGGGCSGGGTGGTLIPVANLSETNAVSNEDRNEDHPPITTAAAAAAAAPADPADITRFMDSRTRSDAFAELFSTVKALQAEMAPFMGCFNEGGYFQLATYTADPGRQITVGQRRSWLTKIRSLSITVEKLLAEYNREVLDMFRLVSSSGGG